MEWTLDFIHISAAFILISFTQRAEVGSERHRTYNGIPFQLTEPTTLFSFQATSFLRSLSSGAASNETKTNKKGKLPNSTLVQRWISSNDYRRLFHVTDIILITALQLSLDISNYVYRFRYKCVASSRSPTRTNFIILFLIKDKIFQKPCNGICLMLPP